MALIPAGAVYADSTLYPNIPGTTTPDRSRPTLVERQGVYYAPIEGTTTPDRGKPVLIERGGTYYTPIPGTTTPDRGGRSWSKR